MQPRKRSCRTFCTGTRWSDSFSVRTKRPVRRGNEHWLCIAFASRTPPQRRTLARCAAPVTPRKSNNATMQRPSSDARSLLYGGEIMLTRNVQMNIRVTPEEKKLFEQAAARCGLTLSQYIRMRLHNQIPRQLPTADYRQVLDALTALYRQHARGTTGDSGHAAGHPEVGYNAAKGGMRRWLSPRSGP